MLQASDPPRRAARSTLSNVVDTTVGAYLEELRERRGISKAKLAKMLGVAWPTLHNWETGRSTPRISNCNLIAEKLKLLPPEKTRLIELARSGPTRREPSTSREAARADRDELNDLLTKALDPKRHTIEDAYAVLGAMSEAMPVLRKAANPQAVARTWLDAASKLRGMGVKVTAPAIAALMLESAQGGGLPQRKAAGG